MKKRTNGRGRTTFEICATFTWEGENVNSLREKLSPMVANMQNAIDVGRFDIPKGVAKILSWEVREL